MEEIEEIITETFEKKIFDNSSKKQFKAKALNLNHEDLNFLLKKAFDLYREGIETDTHFFLIDWLQTIVNIINELKSEVNIVSEVKFSPVNDCASSIINFIKSAKKNLFICVFTISDNEISKEIIAKHKDGVNVKIITDNDKQFDKGSDIQELSDAGIEVKMDETRHHMHHKFAIVDKKYLLTGSYNWTKSAAMYNQENLLILKDEFALDHYLNEFYRLWKTSVKVAE